MPEYDAGFKIAAHHSGRALARIGDIDAQEWEPITGEVHATERLADRAFLARSGRERFVVYMEAYTRWVGSAPWSVLGKSGLLSERERLPTRSLIYVLLPRGYKPQRGRFRLEIESRPTQQVWFREICLWKKKPEPWWYQAPGLMALYPLCRHPEPFPEAVAVAAQAIQSHATDRIHRADLLTTLAIFGKLEHPGFDVIGLIGREAMKESKFYQEVAEEGRVEGRVEEGRRNVLGVVEERFGSAAARAVAATIEHLNDSEELARLVRLAARCKRIADFRKELPNDMG